MLLASCGGKSEPPTLQKSLDAQYYSGAVDRRTTLSFSGVDQAGSAEVTAIKLYQAINGSAPSYELFGSIVHDIVSKGESQAAASLVAVYSNVIDESMARQVLGNLGISPLMVPSRDSFDTLADALTLLFAVYGKQARGQIVLNLVNLLSGLENDITWGRSARAFRTITTANYLFAKDSTNSIISPSALGGKPIFADLSVRTNLATSHALAKSFPADRIVSTIGNYPVYGAPFDADEPVAWALADFLNQGKLSLFTARMKYRRPPPEDYKKTLSNLENYAEFIIWDLVDGEPARQAWKMVSPCIHPSKAVVADFNRDGTPDIFVSCGGYDSDPFPGEKNQLILSSGKNGFKVLGLNGVAQFGGASAADVNGDGYPDIVISHNTASLVFEKKKPYAYFLINNKDGTFSEDYSRIADPDVWKLFYGYTTAVELIDVDGDGHVDLLIAGVDGTTSTQPTKVLYGRNGVFGERITILPSPSVESGVLDFNLVNGAIYIGRQVKYKRNIMQKITLQSLRSEILYDSGEIISNDPKWVHWWIPTAGGLKAWNTNIFEGIIPY
jgi:hypothetical protein